MSDNTLASKVPAEQPKVDGARLTRLFDNVTGTCMLLMAFGLLITFAIPLAVDADLRGALLAVSVGLAAAASGGLLGFLFGIPGKTEPPRPPEPSTVAALKPPSDSDPLKEIARWLTQLITGATLVNLGELFRWIGGVGVIVGRAVGLRHDASRAFGVSLLLYFAVLGFATIYIHAKTILVTIFELYTDQFRVIQERIQRSVDSAEALAARADVMAQEPTLFRLLYQKDGFERAIVVGEGMLRNSADDVSARARVYLACAYGQRYHASHGGAVIEAEVGATEESALASTEAKRAYRLLVEALAIDPNVRSLVLGLLSTRSDPSAPGNDDDLATLAKIPVFAALAEQLAARG